MYLYKAHSCTNADSVLDKFCLEFQDWECDSNHRSDAASGAIDQPCDYLKLNEKEWKNTFHNSIKKTAVTFEPFLNFSSSIEFPR